jgi:hypothetical protein
LEFSEEEIEPESEPEQTATPPVEELEVPLAAEAPVVAEADVEQEEN